MCVGTMWFVENGRHHFEAHHLHPILLDSSTRIVQVRHSVEFIISQTQKYVQQTTGFVAMQSTLTENALIPIE